MTSQLIRISTVFLLSIFFCCPISGQLNKITLDLEKEKPEKFKTKVLRSERTGEKKFTIPRRFIQNTVSHYNYFFNANNKINEVIENARLSNKDDFTKLLDFYSYSLENTSQQTTDLDSVILKATAGILLHDLRSNWVDNLYLLIGKAYYFRKEFDSASMTFQFINYNLYPKKKGQDDQLVVGSNDNGNTSALSIANKEDRDLVNRAFTRPPSRNDAFIWQVRTLIDMGEYGEAAGLINTLQNDPVFPGRLDPHLEEVMAYWFFKQEMYDSSMLHLQNTLPITIDLQDQARREFLLAQLNEMSGSLDTASSYYNAAIHHTVDPLMDIYANLNKAKMLKSTDPEEIDRSIQVLSRMARRDKYDLYRDIIYYAAAELAMEKPDTTQAISLYLGSIRYNESNVNYKNQAFYKLATLSYSLKDYKHAFAYYDSLQLEDTTLGDIEEIRKRKDALAKIVAHINVIEREDSLQLIARMSETERNDFIKKLSKQLRKERGIKDGDSTYFNSAAAYYDLRNPQPDIFSSSSNAQGEWYFYNTSLKSRGLGEFKRLWGKRPNADNWRRSSQGNALVNQTPAAELTDPAAGDPLAPPADNPLAKPAQNNIAVEDELPLIPYQADISTDGLLYNVPLIDQQLQVSNNKIARSLFQLGKNYQVLLEDYAAAIDTYEESLKRFPDSLYAGELYMNLSFCYQKVGNIQKAEYYKNLLLGKFSKSTFSQKIQHPESFEPTKKDPAATKRYQDIYDLFIEGNFEEAIKQKKSADSIYGNNYWDPQLLYIESVYYIRQRQDSIAINRLVDIVNKYPSSPMKEKAETMIDVLERRSSIEEYLTNLEIERAKEDSQILVYYDSARISRNVQQPALKNEPIQQKEVAVAPVQPQINPEKKLEAPVSNADYTFDELQPQSVIMVLNKVDPVYINEARNAFVRYSREKFRTLNLEVIRDTLDKETAILVFNQFETAIDAITFTDRIKKDARAEVSWLPANKYSFVIISQENLEILKNKKNLQDYLQLLGTKYPGKF